VIDLNALDKIISSKRWLRQVNSEEFTLWEKDPISDPT
jgi:hypothetical protein